MIEVRTTTNTGRRRRRIGWALAIVAVFATALSAYQYKVRSGTGKATAQSAGTAAITVAPESLDFGTVWEQPRFPWALSMRNNTDCDVTIEDFYKTCDCTEIEPRTLIVPAHQTVEVKLEINLLAGSARAASGDLDFAIELTPRLKGENNTPPPWLIRGRVRSALRIMAAADLGMHSKEAQPIPALTIPILALVPLERISATCADERFSVDVAGARDDKTKLELRVVPRQRLPQGTIKFEVTLLPKDKNANTIAIRVVTVTGAILADIQPNPPVVAFGARYVGEEAEETITLASLTGRAFEVERWQFEQTEHSNLTIKRGDFGQPALIIQQRFERLGPQSATATIWVKCRVGPPVCVRIPVTYHGLSAK